MGGAGGLAGALHQAPRSRALDAEVGVRGVCGGRALACEGRRRGKGCREAGQSLALTRYELCVCLLVVCSGSVQPLLLDGLLGHAVTLFPVRGQSALLGARGGEAPPMCERLCSPGRWCVAEASGKALNREG